MAAGDDVVCFIPHERCDQVRLVILSLTSRDRSRQTIGLGQCIKSVKISNWDDFTFCSKKAFSFGSVGTLQLFRDFNKTLYMKQYYVGNNDVINAAPYLHATAILDGIVAEKASRTIEDFLKVRVYLAKKN